MRYRFKGMKEYVQKLERLSDRVNTLCAIDKAVTEGSEVVSQYTLNELQAMPVDNSRPHQGERRSINELQKRALIKSFGITPLADYNNLINRKTGVDYGTNRLGQPHVVIARRLENGTSYMPRNPVFSRASRKARKPCLEAMEKSFNESLEALCLNNFKRSK